MEDHDQGATIRSVRGVPDSPREPRSIKRFRNGSSVSACVWGLTCCFASVICRRTRNHFALASRSAARLAPSTERNIKGHVSAPPSWPPCSSRWRCQRWRLAIAARHRQAPLTPATQRGRCPAEGTGAQKPTVPGSRVVALWRSVGCHILVPDGAMLGAVMRAATTHQPRACPSLPSVNVTVA
jgi:hypothetical protein